MLATTLSAALLGIEACPVQVEAIQAKSASLLILVGLPDAAVKESQDRVFRQLATVVTANPKPGLR